MPGFGSYNEIFINLWGMVKIHTGGDANAKSANVCYIIVHAEQVELLYRQSQSG